MLKNKKTMEENDIEAETTIEMSLRLLGGTEENDMKNSFKSEEERENQRKMEETRKSKSTRLSDEALFAQREIIDSITRSDEKMETC